MEIALEKTWAFHSQNQSQPIKVTHRPEGEYETKRIYNTPQCMNISVKRVDNNELHDLQQLSTKTFYEAFAAFNCEKHMQAYLRESLSLSQLTAEWKHPESFFYFAKINRKIVGYIKINWGAAQTEKTLTNALEIERIYVIQQFQGNKIGQKLFEHALSIAQDMKMESIWLGVWEENVRAMKFYEKNGFVRFGTHSFMLGSDEQIDLLLIKELQ